MDVCEQRRTIGLPRVLLLACCIPMVLSHGFLSLLMIFPLTGLFGGDLRQSVFLAWWMIGTAGLAVVVYSAATFQPRRKLTRRQDAGLLAGIFAALPLVLGFSGDWRIAVSAILACCTAGYMLRLSGSVVTEDLPAEHAE